MKYAVFFRNLNLGRPSCPNRDQFEAAFVEAGAISAASFLTNGTLVFETRATRSPTRLVARACATLAAQCGLAEPAFVRDLGQLARWVEAEPFAEVDRSDVFGCYATFLHRDAQPPEGVALRAARRDVEVLRLADGVAFSIARKFGASPGSPNAFLERLLGLPATTRVWHTVVRLVAKHA